MNDERSLIFPKRFQDTIKKFYKFKIVLHVLKFSFVFIRCHDKHFFNLSLNRKMNKIIWIS